MTVSERKRKALYESLDALEAITVLTASNNAAAGREWNELRATVDGLTRNRLDHNLTVTQAELDRLCRILRPTRPFDFYVDYVRGAREFLANDEQLYLARWVLKAFFAGIEAAIPELIVLPQHATISLDVHGTNKPGDRGEVRLIEAALFEDMCALFNRAWCLKPAAEERESRAVMKEASAMRRGAILGAFYVLESYLNSLAFDYLVEHADEPWSSDLDRITEWNHSKKRPQLVSFRDKLIHYPRIILGLPHPPLQENSCPEVKFILEEAKGFRDAIVHANPRADPFLPTSSKELRFWRAGSLTPVRYGTKEIPRQEQAKSATGYWVTTVDNAIALIEKIETLIHGNCDRLFWLQHRGDGGLFNPSVFD